MNSTGHTAVANYLAWLQDPNALMDRQGLADLNTKLRDATDPLERLALREKLLDTEQPPSPRALEADFVTHAKTWAEERGISLKAFLGEGVNPTVLRRAGFVVPRAGGATRSERKPAVQGVTADQVRAAIPSIGTFTVQQLAARSGATLSAARKIVEQQVKKGKIQQIGGDATKDGGGSPALYQTL